MKKRIELPESQYVNLIPEYMADINPNKESLHLMY